MPFCGKAARMGHLMCRECWAAVPAVNQREVNRAWRIVRQGIQQRLTLAQMRTCTSNYRTATDAAIAAVERSRP